MLRTLLFLLRPSKPSHQPVSPTHQSSAVVSGICHFRSLTVNPNQCLTYHAFTLPIIIEHSGAPLALRALLDSGVAGSFIDEETGHQLGLPMDPLLQPIKVNGINGRPIMEGLLTHRTKCYIFKSMPSIIKTSSSA